MITEVQQKRLELEGIRALKQLRIINEKHNFLPTYIEINDSSGYRTEGNGWKGRIITFLPKLYRNLIAIVSYKLPSVWEDPNPLETEERLKSWERDAAEIGLVKVLDENDILADYKSVEEKYMSIVGDVN